MITLRRRFAERSVRNWLGAVFAFLLVLAADASAINDYPRNDLWVTNGRVDAVARSADRIYLGGNFTTVAPFTGAAALLDSATGQRDSRLAKIKGDGFHTAVHAVIPDGAGGWYVGGQFEWVDDSAIQTLVHILPDGRADPDFSFSFAAGPNSFTIVRGLALSASGVLYVVGEFSAVDGQPRANVAAIDTSTHTLTGWAPAPGGLQVNAVLLSGDTVLLGGSTGLIAADPTSAALQTLNGSLKVQAMALSDNGATLYFGGIGLMAYSIANQQMTAWNPAPNGSVNALEVSGSTVYVGGSFTSIGGQSRSNLAAINGNTGAASSWDPAPDGPVAALVLDGTGLYVAGAYSQIGGQARRGFAEVDIIDASVGVIDPRLTTRIQAESIEHVLAVALAGGRLMVGGRFAGAGAVARRNIAALDAHTGAATDWAPDADNVVQNLLLDGDTLYAHGLFNNIGGQPRVRLAALDLNLNTNNAKAFVADVGGQCFDMARAGNALYLAGTFTSINGEARANVAAVDAATGSLTSWNPGADAIVYAIDVVGNFVYLGGQFTAIDNQFRNALAAVDATTGAVFPFDPNATFDSNAAGPLPYVRDFVVSDGKIYASGSFQNIGGLNRQNFAELDAFTGQATDLDLQLDNGMTPTLAKRGNLLFMAGLGTQGSIQGVQAAGVAAFSLPTGAMTDWRPVESRSTTKVRVLNDQVILFGHSIAYGAPRLNSAYAREYGLVPDESGTVVDFSHAYVSLAASLAPALADGDIDNNGRFDVDEFACLASLLSQGDASLVPQVASTFLLNRDQMGIDVGEAYLAQHPGADALFAGWLMFGNAGWIGTYVENCAGCSGRYAANAYHFTVNPDIATAFALCTIRVEQRVFSNGFE